MKSHTQKFIQRRKFIMVLPLLVLPFLTMLFWALGGGRGVSEKTQETIGLNMELPDANLKDGKDAWNKLSLYDKAQRDSMKQNEAKRNDPYFRLRTLQTNTSVNQQDSTKINASLDHNAFQDSNEVKATKKIEQIYKELSKPAASQQKPAISTGKEDGNYDPNFRTDVDRLESMMELMHTEGQPDPEMQQIENVLEKLLEVQHPEMVRQKIKDESTQNQGRVYPVSMRTDQSNISLIESNKNTKSKDIGLLPNARLNKFYGLGESQVPSTEGNSIEAIIHDTQTITPGSTIKLRLLTDIYVNGSLIAKDNFLYGISSINGERLVIKINSIRLNDSLYPVALTVYDLDGLEGIYIPGVLTQDAAKQASNQALQSMQLYSLDPSVGAQAASAGIQTVKGLIGKKTKMIKVMVKAGYKVLLMDTNSKTQ